MAKREDFTAEDEVETTVETTAEIEVEKALTKPVTNAIALDDGVLLWWHKVDGKTITHKAAYSKPGEEWSVGYLDSKLI
jgi:hypothetical protein